MRRAIGYVAQEPFLTDGSVADNIAYGESAPDPARVEASAHEFIAAMPQAYASQVGERSGNTPDPGIVAIATILQDWCKEYGVDRTPVAAELAKATA